MSKNQVTNPITDEEIAFARLVLSGTMTDRCAAGAAGLNPDTAAYTKARLGAYLQDHPAPVQQQFVAQDTDLSRLSRQAVERAVDERRPFTVTRDQILTRLWEIAAIGPEITRGSLAGQVKALSMIAAIEGLIPDRRARSAQNQPAPPQVTADIYESEWLRARRNGETVEPSPAVHQEQPASDSSSGSAPPTQKPTHPPTPSCAPGSRWPITSRPTPGSPSPSNRGAANFSECKNTQKHRIL